MADGAARVAATSSSTRSLPEFKRRLKLVGLPDDVLERYPDRALGRDEAARRDGALVAARPVAADRRRGRPRRSTSRSQRAVAELLVEFRDRGFVKSMIVITHDLSVLYQIADTILVMYAGKLAEKAPAETMVDAPRHPYTQLLLSSLPEVGRALRRAAARPASPAVRRRCSTRRRGCRFRARCPFAFDAVRARSRRSRRSSPATPPPAGRRPPDARARHLLQGLPTGAFGRGELLAVSDVSFARASRARSSSLIGESGSGKSTIGKMILRLCARRAARSRSTASTSRRSRAAQLKAYYARRPGRLPGSVQLVQPDLQGRPRLRDAPQRSTSRARARPSGRRSCERVARGGEPQPAATCSTSTRTS